MKNEGLNDALVDIDQNNSIHSIENATKENMVSGNNKDNSSEGNIN